MPNGKQKMTARSTGTFIVFESIDGAGSSTQIKNVAAALRAAGHSISTTAQPSTGPVGKLIRRYLGGALPKPSADIRRPFMTMLFSADRLEHYAGEIAPALARGSTVLCDRYYASTLAYQTIGLDKQQWIAQLSTDVVQPDFQVYIRVNPKVGMDRVAKRNGKREFYETLRIQQQVHQNYEAYFASIPESKFLLVNGEQSPAEITESIVRELGRRFFP